MLKTFLITFFVLLGLTFIALFFFGDSDNEIPLAVETSSTSQSQTKEMEKVELPLATTNEPSLEEKIGQLFIIGHWSKSPVASTTDMIKEHHLGGVIIMDSPDRSTKVANWSNTWQSTSSIPLLITVDQEGGTVSRFKGPEFIQTSQNEITDQNKAYAVGVTRGKELSGLGINMNFAPVLDSANNPNSFMYQRVFKNKKESASLATSMIKGMKENEVLSAVKHFPGHDDSSDDSHLVLPVVDITLAELDDFVSPFAELIGENPPPAMMTAHVLFPQIDTLPATLSKFFLTDYLQNELNYTGVIITDDMSMDAIDNNWTSSEATILAIEAGADIVLFAAEPELVTDAIEAVKQAVEDKRLTKERIDESYKKIMALKVNLDKNEL